MVGPNPARPSQQFVTPLFNWCHLGSSTTTGISVGARCS
jgi:hypothetical protein